jgi:TonB family protein
MRPFRLILALTVFAATALGQVPEDASGQQLGSLKGRTLILRNFYRGGKLRYDEQGQLLKGGKPGSWTYDGFIRVTDVTVEPTRMILRAERLEAFYDDGHIQTGNHRVGKVTLEMALAPTHEQVASAIRKVFMTAGERVEDSIPNACKTRATVTMPKAGECESGVCRVGSGISAPRPIHAPDPEYSDLARQAKFQGTVVLRAVIRPDGTAGEVCVQRPIGQGLDEKAIEAVKVWRFEPAKRDGKPLAVVINIEINFRLY